MGWAALYKDMLGDIWVVRADRAHMHHETGVEIWEAVVFRWGTWLNDPDYENAPGDTWHEAGSASEWLDDKDTHSFDITGDVVEGVIPTLAWAESIILSPQELLLRAWKKPPKKNPRKPTWKDCAGKKVKCPKLYHATSARSAASMLKSGVNLDAKRVRDPGDFGWGFYTTGDLERADYMGERILEVFIDQSRFAYLPYPYFLVPRKRDVHGFWEPQRHRPSTKAERLFYSIAFSEDGRMKNVRGTEAERIRIAKEIRNAFLRNGYAGIITPHDGGETVIFDPAAITGMKLLPSTKKNPRESGKWEYLKHGLHGGAGILFVHKNRMLLMRRSDQVRNPHQWGIPGGGAESRESPWATAVRETAEEAGWRAYRLAEKAGDVREYNGPTGFTTFVVFVKEEFKPKLNWEHDAWKWVTRRQADRMNLHKGVRKMLMEGI
jgi:8-oxo-dGTP diphosphatase